MPIRVAVVCSEAGLAGWEADCVRDLVDEGRCLPVGCLVVAGTGKPLSPEERVPCARIWPGLALEVPGQLSDGNVGAGPRALQALRQAEIDFFLRCVGDTLDDALLATARWGAFGLEVGSGPGHGLEEVVGGAATLPILVRWEGGSSATGVVEYGAVAVDRTSLKRTRAIGYRAAGELLSAAVQRAAIAGSPAVPPQPVVPTAAPGLRGRAVLRRAALASRGHVQALATRLLIVEQWNVGVVPLPIGRLLDEQAWADAPIQWLPAPRRAGRMLADPFGVRTDGGFTVLAEDFDMRVGRGCIVAVEITSAGEERRRDPVMVAGVHLAYPYVFEHEGEIFCVPDASFQREINLFRAVEFPTKWEKAATLIRDWPGVDSTVFRHEGRWWILGGRRGDLPHAKLHGWHAEDLLGPWRPHAVDPLKVDVSSARPAGTPFVVDGVLYRPSQDCSRSYGERIVVNRVDELDPLRFREEPVVSFAPASGPFRAGCHTVSALGPVTLIDGKRRLVSFRKLIDLLSAARHRTKA